MEFKQYIIISDPGDEQPGTYITRDNGELYNNGDRIQWMEICRYNIN